MRFLLTGSFNYSPEQLKVIEGLGLEVFFLQQEADSLPIPASSIDGVVCNGLFLFHDIEQFSSLKYIQLTSAGLDRVPLKTIQERGIVINNARGVYSIPVAEWALGRILEHYKHFPSFNNKQINRDWNKDRGTKEVNGTRVAIIGAGDIGQEIAKRLFAFGACVTGFDVVLDNKPYFDEILHVSTIHSYIQQYDIVIVATPLTDETKHMISKPFLESMKKDAMLINIARGALIDEEALLMVLKERPDLFAVLDVFEKEPLASSSCLWTLSNVAISPHNSFVSNRNNDRMFAVICNNLKKYLVNE